jgi:DNA-binding beta-propeller fold protein YncE
MLRRDFLAMTAALALPPSVRAAATGERHRLYIAEPGIRNDQLYGGVGVLVFEIGPKYRFLKRIPTWSVLPGKEAENVKGITASATTGRLYVSTIEHLGCFDLRNGSMIWDKAPEGGCDRLAISPDGRTLYVPSFEGPHWNIIDAAAGNTLAKVVTNSGAHNTICSLDGTAVYLAGLHSPLLSVLDVKSRRIVRTIGPFTKPIRPFTVNATQTRCYVNVNELLGFEVGDLTTGAMLHRVEVKGYQPGLVKRHGCPSHGIGLTPDESELWVSDSHNNAMHVFDATVDPPRQKTTVHLRDQPGWITFSIDGRRAYPSTGEVFDARTKQKITGLADETGRDIGSEKLLEVVFNGDRPVRAGDQFGLGALRQRG